MSVTQELVFKNREILVKRDSETSPKFGLEPEKRDTDTHLNYGIVNIDKPKGPTSHQVSAYVQKILGISKSGHSGTLDPGVTGVLPIALSKATKVVQALLISGKEYVAIMHLHDDYSEGKIRNVCDKFVGDIRQLPPVRSAVKRRLRTRRVYYIKIMEIDRRDVLFRVGCEAGTYIRKLIHDIGKDLGTGAHMVELRRTKAGPFDESTLCSMQDLHDAFWLWKAKKDDSMIRSIVKPMENAVTHLPKIWVLDTTVDSLCHGAQLKIPGISKFNAEIHKDQMIAIMTLKGELIALARARMESDEIKKESRGIAARLERVFMETGVYPRIDKA